MSDAPRPAEGTTSDDGDLAEAAPNLLADAAPTAAAPLPPPEKTSQAPALLGRERAANGPGLGRGIAIAVVVAAALPAGGALWLAGVTNGPTSAPTTPATVATETAPSPPGGYDAAGLQEVIGALEAQAAAAAALAATTTARAEEAERGARLRGLQKEIALARDARRAAGQTGPALKGPFPVDELGGVVALGFGPTRWLTGRDGAVLLPASTRAPVSLAAAGREEEPATIAATVDGEAVLLWRRCVPFEPYCIIDVVPATPPPPAPAIDLTALRAWATAQTMVAAPASTVAAAIPAPIAVTPGASATARAVVAVVALMGLVIAIVTARRLQRLGGALTALAWRLQSGLGGRASPAQAHDAAELALLEHAIGDAHAAVARLGTVEDDAAWRRGRAEAAADLLLQACERGGLDRLTPDGRDDAATARVIGATNTLLDALDGRHRRIAMGLTEIDGTVRLVTPLAQRLLLLARVEGLPAQAADELTSLGTSLGQRARRPQVLPGLMRDIAALTPRTASIVDVAAAVEPLGEDGARLAARQLEGAVTDV